MDDSQEEIDELDEDDLSQICSAHQSLIVNQIFPDLEEGKKRNDNNNKNINVASDLYSRFNVVKEEKLILQPKFNHYPLTKYVQPTYYDTIFVLNPYYGEDDKVGPQLEPHYNFD